MRTGDYVKVIVPRGEPSWGYVVKVLHTGNVMVAVEDLKRGGFEPRVMRPEAVSFQAGGMGVLPSNFHWARNGGLGAGPAPQPTGPQLQDIGHHD